MSKEIINTLNYIVDVTPTIVNLQVVEAMVEIEVDISKNRSKSINKFDGKKNLIML